MKQLIALFAFTLYTLSGISQETTTVAESRLSPKVGIKAGLNLSNFYASGSGNSGVIKPGINAGAFMMIPLSQRIAIQTEILYSMKGTSLNYNNIILGNGRYRFHLNYLEVPVAAAVRLGDKFSIHAGPYMALLLSASINDAGGNIKHINASTELNKGGFETFDYGLFGGMAYNFGKFNVGGRYSYGLKKVGKNGISGNITQESKNYAISFYIGLGF